MIIMASKKRNKIRGYTLVEVMVAMLIAFIVLGGVYQTITRETIDRDREVVILDMQNNARVAIDRITRELRRTGFLGCGGDLAVNTLTNRGTSTTLLGTKTSAVEPTVTTAVDYWRGEVDMLTELKAGALVDYLGVPLAFKNGTTTAHPYYDLGTDAISLVYLGSDVALDPANIMASGTSPVRLKDEALTKGDIVMITDCRDYSLFQKTNCSSTKLVARNIADDCSTESPALTTFLNPIADADLGKAYGNEAPTRVYNLKISTFFVRDSQLRHNLDKRIIANNIEDLQFEFVNAAEGDADLSDNGWSATPAVAPEVVRAIRVSVLARSEVVNDYTNPDTYTYAGETYTPPNDHRYRYLASAAVYLRNAGIN